MVTIEMLDEFFSKLVVVAHVQLLNLSEPLTCQEYVAGLLIFQVAILQIDVSQAREVRYAHGCTVELCGRQMVVFED